MGAFDQINNLPVSSAAYYDWINGWVFGADSNANSCGAMPFRHGTGIYSDRCLRGEDWAFLQNVCLFFGDLPSGQVFGLSAATFPQLTTSVEGSHARSMYDFLHLVETTGCYGDGYSIADNSAVEIVQPSVWVLPEAADYLLNPVHMASLPLPASGDVDLSLTRMQTFFSDAKKMECTVANVNYDYAAGGDPLYYYRHEYGSSPTTNTNNILSAWKNTPYIPSTQKVSMDCMLLVPVSVSVSDGSGSHDEKYALVAVGGVQTMTNSAASPHVLTATYSPAVSGQTIAELASSATGLNITPSPTESHQLAYASVQVYGFNLAVVWPKWLRDY